MMKRMIPNIFYEELRDGLDLFVEGLGFKILYQDDSFVVILRDNAKIFLVRDAVMAAQDRTPITLETDSIESDYEEVKRRDPTLLHPDFRTILPTSWGGREFGVLGATGVCVMIRQLDV